MNTNEKKISFYIFYFFSGFSALLFQLCWIKKSIQIFGSTGEAVSTVFAIFFGGTALGATYFKRNRHTKISGATLYGMIELLIGICALSTLLLFPLMDWLFSQAYPYVFESSLFLTITRIVMVTIVIFPTVFFMGGTYPTLCRYFVDEIKNSPHTMGLLYTLNTAGALSAVLLGGIYCIPYIGYRATLTLGGIIALTIGIIIYFTTSKKQGHQSTEVIKVATSNLTPYKQIFFSAGFVALSYEILWIRFLSLILHSTVYTYIFTLATVLGGICIGALTHTIIIDRLSTKVKETTYGVIFLAIALSTIVILFLFPTHWLSVQNSQSLWEQFYTTVQVMFIPSFALGLLFPLGLSIVYEKIPHGGTISGILTAWNTWGAIAGSLITTYFAIPLLGLDITITVITLICFFVALYILLLKQKSLRLSSILLSITAIAITITILNHSPLPETYLNHSRSHLIEVIEGKNSNLTVSLQNGKTVLEIDRLWQGQRGKTRQIIAAHLPMLLHNEPKDICVIGVGTGQTARSFLHYPSLVSLHCIDVEEKLFPLMEKYFDGQWLKDKRVKPIIDDGNAYMRHTNSQYDIISIEVGQTYRPNLAGFYTQEFYTNASKKLKQGGIVSQFLPLSSFTPQEFRSAVKTFLSVFPHSSLWYNTEELLLIGSLHKNNTLQKDIITTRLSVPNVSSDLAFSYWGGKTKHLNIPKNLVANFLCDSEALNRIAQGGTIYHANKPTLEYVAAQNQFNKPYFELITREISSVLKITNINFTKEELTQIEQTRKYNFKNIFAETFLRYYFETGDHTLLFQAVEQNPANLKVLYTLGKAMLKNGKDKEAYDNFTTILKYDPEHVKAMSNIADLYMKRKQFPQAFTTLKKVEQLNPNIPSINTNLAILYDMTEERERAEYYFKRVVELDPHSQSAKENLKRFLERGKK